MSEATLRALAAGVFGSRGTIGIVRVGTVGPDALHPDEIGAIRGAVPARVLEFAAGRVAARSALGTDDPVPSGPDRAPIWPDGWAGSISHASGWAIAVAQRGGGLVGVDLEPDEDLPAETLSVVLRPAELRGFGTDLRWARRIFSIKEAVYKAQYPFTRQIFDFQTLEVRVDKERFEARFTTPVNPFREGHVIAGVWASAGGFFLAGVID